MSAILAIARKDLRQRLRDRSAIVLGFIAPMAVAGLISVAFGSTGSFHANVAVVDLDRGGVATAFTSFLHRPELADLLTVTSVAGEADARSKVAKGDVSAAFVIPKGFSAAIDSGQGRPITVLASVDSSVRLIGHATPHAWAVDAWVTLLSRGGGLADIAGYLAILAAYAVALLGIASLRLRRSLVTA
jgi:hypothetical protein